MAQENDTNGTIVYVCPECLCSSILFVKKQQLYWCRKCGHEWKKKEFHTIKEPEQ